MTGTYLFIRLKEKYGLNVLIAEGEHQANVQTVSRNEVQQSSERKTQTPQNPSPVITPTPELEVAFGKGLKIVPKTVELENQRRRYKIYLVYPHIEGS